MGIFKKDGISYYKTITKLNGLILHVFLRNKMTGQGVHFQHEGNLSEEQYFYILRTFQGLYIR